MDLFKTGNLIEGIFWLLVSTCFAVSLQKPERRTSKIVAMLNFLAFGLSDFVEMTSEAWWDPWWLLTWKVACVCVMGVQLIRYYKHRRRTALIAAGRPADPDS